MICLNPFLDSLCNFGFKNGGLHSGGDIEWFPGPQDVVTVCVGYSKNNVQWWKQRPCTSKHAVLSLWSILSHFSNHTGLWFVISLQCSVLHKKYLLKQIKANNYLCKQYNPKCILLFHNMLPYSRYILLLLKIALSRLSYTMGWNPFKGIFLFSYIHVTVYSVHMCVFGSQKLTPMLHLWLDLMY